MLKIAFIAMSGVRVSNPRLASLGLTLPGFIERAEVIASLPSLGLLTLAAYTPAQHEVQYLELPEYSDQMSLPGEFDVVAISSFTAQILDAYRLADAYRKLGTLVVLGGLHVTACPMEAKEHADAIIVGEAELCWERLLLDIQNACLKDVYSSKGQEFDLATSRTPRYDLLDPGRYNRITVQTQRGCPYRCEFCASSIQLTEKYKSKPVDLVFRDIEAIKSVWRDPFIELADDNSFANKKHARLLVQAIAKQQIKWFTETDISVADDHELISMLADSGCRQLLVGLESPPGQTLAGIETRADWKAKRMDRYGEAIHRIQSHGISVNGCFVFGFDHHDHGIFDDTLDFVEESGLSEVQITLQTPFPGTPLYHRLKKEERLLKEVFWDQCTLFDVTFTPRKMTVQELETGFENLMLALYSNERTSTRKRRFVKMRGQDLEI
ncbi:MAG: B12-binding domain-containing radical SAM protein [Sneathiellales bacterium]|nr:B12-binding domain-containing radical SAM protein [Sneathiellales bacterium]